MKSKYTFSLYLKLGKGPSPFDSDTRQHILYCTNRDGERCNIDVRVKVVAEQGKFLTLMSRSKIYPVFATTTFTPRKKSLCVYFFYVGFTFNCAFLFLLLHLRDWGLSPNSSEERTHTTLCIYLPPFGCDTKSV